MNDQNQQGQESAPPPMTIQQRKVAVCTSLQEKFNTPKMRERLINLARGDESLVIANLNSFLTILVNDEGTGKFNQKKYLVDASTSSLSLCFMESMQIGIPIDRRGLVHVVVYGLQAELEIDYRGFIYYLNKHYTDADFDIKLVFEGDTFHHWSKNGDDFYEYEKDKSRTKNDYTKVIWAFCFMTYTKNGATRSKLEVMDKRELDLVKSKAKTQNVWDEWLGEMYKKAVCRRACKLPLAAVDENAIEFVDNKNFALDRPAAMDRLEHLINNQEDMLNEKKGDDTEAGGKNTPADIAPSSGGESPVNDIKKPADKGEEIADPLAPAADMDPPAPSPAPAENAGPRFKRNDEGTADRHESSTVAAAAPAGEWEWDGKTLIIGGKEVVKEFIDAPAALSYLREVISKRRSKESRKAIIAENPLLMGALIRQAKGAAIAELHKLADQGV